MHDCERCGKRVVWLSLVGNFSLAVFKVIVGALGGSSALVADGFHSFADVLGSTSILVSTKISGRPPDADHPYGHGKAEFLGSALVYTVLLFFAFGIFAGGVIVMTSGEMEPPHFVTVLGALVSVAYNVIMYLLAHCAGTRLSSPAILADAFENRADAMSSVACIVGIGGAVLIHPICDPIAAMIVGLVIFANCVTQLKEAIAGLMDRSLPTAVEEGIEQIAMTHEGVSGVEFLKTRLTGPRCWVDLGVQVPKDTNVARSDEIAKSIRSDLMQRSGRFEHVEVFVLPSANDQKRSWFRRSRNWEDEVQSYVSR